MLYIYIERFCFQSKVGLVGCMKLELLANKSVEFGMFAIDPSHQSSVTPFPSLAPSPLLICLSSVSPLSLLSSHVFSSPLFSYPFISFPLLPSIFLSFPLLSLLSSDGLPSALPPHSLIRDLAVSYSVLRCDSLRSSLDLPPESCG